VGSQEALGEVISATYEPTEGSLILTNSEDWVKDMSLELAHWDTIYRSSKKERSGGPCHNACVSASPFLLSIFRLTTPEIASPIPFRSP
jgi:hypothetical protein